jgi:hypothetical protein
MGIGTNRTLIGGFLALTLLGASAAQAEVPRPAFTLWAHHSGLCNSPVHGVCRQPGGVLAERIWGAERDANCTSLEVCVDAYQDAPTIPNNAYWGYYNDYLQSWIAQVEGEGAGAHFNLRLQPRGGGYDYQNFHVRFLDQIEEHDPETGETWYVNRWSWSDSETGASGIGYGNAGSSGSAAEQSAWDAAGQIADDFAGGGSDTAAALLQEAEGDDGFLVTALLTLLEMAA